MRVSYSVWRTLLINCAQTGSSKAFVLALWKPCFLVHFSHVLVVLKPEPSLLKTIQDGLYHLESCLFHVIRLDSRVFFHKDRKTLAQWLKIPKKSHSTLRAKRAMFTFWVDKSSLKMPKIVNFCEFLKNEICGQTVLPDRSILIGQKYQNSYATFWVIFIQYDSVWKSSKMSHFQKQKHF